VVNFIKEIEPQPIACRLSHLLAFIRHKVMECVEKRPMHENKWLVERFEENRPRLRGVAYRIAQEGLDDIRIGASTSGHQRCDLPYTRRRAFL